MNTAVMTLHIIVSVFLVIVVLLQVGKGASIGASFGGSSSQTLFGGAGPATFLSKLTAGCAIIFMITSLSLTYMSAHKSTSSIMQSVPKVEQKPQPVEPQQTAPLAAPQNTGDTTTK